MTRLITTALDLLGVIGRANFKLILGGGYGLYLKQLHLQSAPTVRTLLPGELWPYPRTTEDLDVFLPTEIVASLEDMRAIRAALDSLGFRPVAGAEFLHFEKPWHGGGRVKIDMLTGPITERASRRNLKITPPRVRPRGDLQLHAYLTNEAIDFDQALLPLPVSGTRSDGTQATATIFIPQPFSFLLMKLHAFADRVADANRDLGRHHALDIYQLGPSRRNRPRPAACAISRAPVISGPSAAAWLSSDTACAIFRTSAVFDKISSACSSDSSSSLLISTHVLEPSLISTRPRARQTF
jgi:hypothetical protein